MFMCGCYLYRFVTLVDNLICDVLLSQGYTGARGEKGDKGASGENGKDGSPVSIPLTDNIIIELTIELFLYLFNFTIKLWFCYLREVQEILENQGRMESR